MIGPPASEVTAQLGAKHPGQRLEAMPGEEGNGRDQEQEASGRSSPARTSPGVICLLLTSAQRSDRGVSLR